MPVAKFSESTFGMWATDAMGLPCFDFDLSHLPPYAPPFQHRISSGMITALVNLHGQVNLYHNSYPHPALVAGYGKEGWSAFTLSLKVAGQRDWTCLHEPERFPDATFRWGTNYALYAAAVQTEEGPLTVEICLRAPWNAAYVVCELNLKNAAAKTQSVDLQVTSDVIDTPPLGSDMTEFAPFCKDGAVIFPTHHTTMRGDFFIAGPADWNPNHVLNTLCLTHKITLPENAEASFFFLLGCHQDCTLEWLSHERKQLTPAILDARWKQLLQHATLTAPELWMREECTWNAAEMLATRTYCVRENTTAHERETAADLLQTIVTGREVLRRKPGLRIRAEDLRQLLVATLPLTLVNPELAMNNLQIATTFQRKNGRLQTDGETRNQLRPAADPADLEIWFILAWMEYLEYAENPGQILALPVRGSENKERLAPGLWQRLVNATTWLQNAAGVGAHGLMRIGAGDCNPLLNRVGTEGKGESTLNTALLCYALDKLVRFSQKRQELPSGTVEPLQSWHRQLLTATSDAFDDRWFVRAYTDDGAPIGVPIRDRMFTDVQAWAVLARCGTEKQRARALDELLDHCPSESAIPTLTRPYPLPLPADISSRRLPPGHGANGGGSVMVNAWAIWALASDGRYEQALQQWRRASTRLNGILPGEHRDSWQHFAMAMILKRPPLTI